MKILLLIQCLALGMISYGQSELNIDSIKNVLKVNKFKSVDLEINTIKKVCEYYQYKNKDSTIKYARALENAGRKYNNANGIFNGCFFQYSHFYYSGEFAKCLYPYLNSYKEIKLLDDAKVEVLALVKIAQIYSSIRHKDSSKYYINIALKTSIKENYELGKIMCYSHIGSTFYSVQQLDSAMIYYLKGEKSCAVLNAPNNFCASICKMIAKIHVHKDEYDKAINKYLIAQSQFKENGNIKAYNTTNTRIANVLTRIGEYDKAKQKLDSSYSYFKSKGYFPDLITCLFEMSNLAIEQKSYTRNLEICKEIEQLHSKNEVHLSRSINNEFGKAYYFVGDFNRAILFLEKAYKEALNKENNSKQENALFYLCKAYSKAGQFEKSTEYYEKYIQVHEINEKLKSKEFTSDIEAKYQSKKQEQEIEILKSQNALAEEQKMNQLSLLISGVVISTLIGIIFFFLYYNKKKTSKKLQEIDLIKTRFFENISHEFRTPLTLIKLPLSQAISSNRELKEKDLNLMHNNASRLQNLIEDLLSLSELEAGKMKIKKTSQDPLVQINTLCSQFDSYAESKGISYQKVIERNSIKATYDKSVLDKVLSNLISNAIKYSENGGEVQVSAAVVDQSLVLKVSDKGDGISPEDQEKIFDRFYRVGESNNGKQGSGIGLALVERLLKINNGSIKLTSKINEGTTFTAIIPLEDIIQLPFEPYSKTASKKKGTKKNTMDLLENVDLSTKPKLLITEDNKELLEYISNLFKEDFQIINAVNGIEGMQKALEHVPDFIISDWMMPKRNGLEFCNEIKTNSITSHIPFLLLTAKSMVEDKIEGYEIGADAYFSKPFNFDELKSRINGLLKQRTLLYEKYRNLDAQLSAPVSNSLDVKFWEEFKNYLKTNIQDSELSSSKIATHLGMSRMQLHRKLTSLTGQNLSAFIKNQRMNLACELLKDKSYRISEVCYEIGYEDKSAFARAFKKEFGLTPTQYRDKE